MVKQHFFQRRHEVFVLAAILLFGGSKLSAVQQETRELVPYRFFTLKNISPEQGKKFLEDARIGAVSYFPGSSALLVTAQPQELTKARAILDLIDQRQRFVLQEIFPASSAGNLPSKEQIEAKLGNVSIGSFTTPPAGQDGIKAIIDTHNNAAVAVAPEKEISRIVSAVRQLYNSRQSEGQITGPETSLTKIETNTVAALLGQQLTDQNTPKIQVLEQKEMEQKATEQTAVLQQPAQQQIPPDASAAVQPSTSVPIPNADDVIKLTLPEKQTMVQFLGMVGPYLRMDFMYNEVDLAEQEVTFNPNGKYQGPITVRDLYHLLESVLQFKGYVMTRGTGNLVMIVPKDSALEIDPALIEPEKPEIGVGDIVVMRVFKLNHITAAGAKEFLEGMKLTTDIKTIAETKTLIVTAYAHRMSRIQALLDIVDRPGEPRKFRFRQLRYTMAQTLAPKLQGLATELGTISITIASAEEQETPPPARPIQRSGETTSAFQARLKAWEAQVSRQRQQQQTAARVGITPQAEAAAPSVYLDADERTNRILMIGLAEQLDDVEELIDTLDVAQQDLRTLIPYRINHLDAEDARKKLEEFGIIGPPKQASATSSRITGDIKSAVTTPQTTRPQTTTPVSAGFQMEEATEPLAGEPQVVVIESINALLINATAEQHERIAAIIEQVDQQRPEGEIPYKIYPLENSSPAHLKELLTQLIEETVETQQSEQEKIVTVTTKRREEKITIVDDPNTFSLIVYANKKNQEWIAKLIETLDKRRPQVLIDVTLVEVSRVDLFDLDLDLVSKLPKMAAGGNMEYLDALVEPFAEDRVTEVTSFSGEGQGFYSDQHIQALIKAMQTKSYGRVLAKPKILVNDGQEGKINTKDFTNVRIEQIIVPEEGTQRTTTDFREYEAGIELIITPNISEGDLLFLQIQMVRSDFGETPVEGAPPNTTRSEVNTRVTVPDSQTIILGGLIKLNQTKGGSKVPLLGDLPLLGGLFRSTSNTDRSSNLYVFVKANILRPDDTIAGLPDLERMSDRNRASFERLEDQFQNYEDWPGFKPKPMEPFKVLDAE